MANSNLYQVQNIHYEYDWNKQKVPVLKGIHFELPKESFTCLIGPSGVGKTTLLNLMGLIEHPSQGQIVLDGVVTKDLSEKDLEQLRLRDLGFVFQAFYLIPTLTVLENASYFLQPMGHSAAKAHSIALEVLDILGLADHKNKKPNELSGGQRQRVAIARALAKKPKVILADEPTANLDSATSTRIIKAFQEIQKSNGTSFIFSTHDSHLMSYAKDIIQMNDGQIVSRKENEVRT